MRFGLFDVQQARKLVPRSKSSIRPERKRRSQHHEMDVIAEYSAPQQKGVSKRTIGHAL